MSVAVVYFRHGDCRVSDLPALCAAVGSESVDSEPQTQVDLDGGSGGTVSASRPASAVAANAVVPVYIWCDSPERIGHASLGPSGTKSHGGDASTRRQFELECVRHLDAALRDLNSRLVVRRVPSPDKAAHALLDVAKECGATSLHMTRSYDPFLADADSQLCGLLRTHGVAPTLHDGSVLVSPESVKATLPHGYARTFDKFSSLLTLPKRPTLSPPTTLLPPPTWPASEDMSTDIVGASTTPEATTTTTTKSSSSVILPPDWKQRLLSTGCLSVFVPSPGAPSSTTDSTAPPSAGAGSGSGAAAGAGAGSAPSTASTTTTTSSSSNTSASALLTGPGGLSPDDFPETGTGHAGPPKPSHVVSVGTTSQLSAVIAAGLVSVRELWAFAANHLRSQCAVRPFGTSTRRSRAPTMSDVSPPPAQSSFSVDVCKRLLRKLALREFAHHHVHNHPEVATSASRSFLGSLPWAASTTRADANPTAVAAFCRGMTGYPLVDAAVRCLTQTGWLHHRLRVLLANFWTKYLRQGWMDGMAWMLHLSVDADVPSAIVSWQWAVGLFDDVTAPHAHVSSDPIGVEFRQHGDPDGRFIRKWVPELASMDVGFLGQPFNATPDVLRAAKVALGSTYPNPIVPQTRAREATLDSVMECYTSHNRAPGAPPPHHHRAVWGLAGDGQHAIIVEEDHALLLMQEKLDRSQGWNQVCFDKDRQLEVNMKASTGKAKVVLTQITYPDLPAQHVFDSMVDIKKLLIWDGTWMEVDEVEQVDQQNQVLYLLADTPPPPFRHVVTQRDFLMLRSVRADPKANVYSIVLRNGVSPKSPPKDQFVRGETLGCVGFVVRARPPPLTGSVVTFATACDLKGRIPTWLVNWVAKKTPFLWSDRLARMVRENYLGHEPIDTKVPLRDWK